MRIVTNKAVKRRKFPFFYGWIIIFISAMGLFFSGPGQTFSISVFINSYISKFGWSRSLISSLYSFATLLAGFMVPYVGRKIDTIGHRKILVIISILLGITCLWMSFVFNPVMLFIGFMFLRLLGQGSMTLIPSTLVCQWFIKRRGRALSIMALGGVLSSAVIPVINNAIIQKIGIQFAWIVWGLLLIFLMAPLGWSLVQNRPEDLGLSTDGEDKSIIVSKKLANEAKGFKDKIKNPKVEQNWTLEEVTKTRTFWLMIFSSAIPSMINTGMTFHMVSIMEGKNMSPAFAAYLLGLTALIQMPLKFAAGYLVDRVKVHYIKAVNYWVLFFSLVLIVFGSSKEVLIIFAIANGFFGAFESVASEVLWPNYYGRKYLGSIRSIAMTAMVIGSALGPLPFGFAYDSFNGYREILTFMMIFPVMASIASFFSPPPPIRIES